MNVSLKRLKLLYEIALTIGEGENQPEAALNVLSVYLQLLNCNSAAIFKKEIEGEFFWYREIGSLPEATVAERVFEKLNSVFPQSPQKAGLEVPDSNFPIFCPIYNDTYTIGLLLPGFGIMVLTRKGKKFPKGLIIELQTINKKLAKTLNDFDHTEKLQNQVKELKSDKNVTTNCNNQQEELAKNVFQKNENLLRTLVHSIPDLLWLKDKDGVYLACNPGFESFFGATEFEIAGKTDYDFVGKELGDFFREHDKKAMTSGKPTINEEEVIFANDGHKAMLETIKTPIKDEQGIVNGVLGIARDITERKITENTLKESNERFQEITNLLPQPIWETDVNGKFIFVNNAGFEVLGYTREAVEKGLNFLEVIAPNDRQRIAENFSKKLQGIETNDYEYTCLKKTGEIFPVLIYTSPIRKNDNIVGVRGITLDISSLKQAQEGLKYFSALQDVLIHISTKYINVSTDEIDQALHDALREIGEFVSADRAYIFNYDFKKEVTKNTYEWCSHGIEPQIGNLQEVPFEAIPLWVEKHLKAETVYIPDVLALPPGDDLREVLEPQNIKSLIAVPMMHGGECFGFIGFDSVNTHHTYSNKERAILEVFAQMVVNFQLRSQVEHELKQAKEKAENAEKAQFSFLSTMSHEIRTPLNAVVGLTNILLMENPKPSQLENLNILKFSSQNLLSIINDILDYNKLVSGNVVLEQADFSIQEILKGMHYAMSSVAKAKEITLDYTIANDIPELIVGDSTRLLQIINNLVSNAMKFTKNGGVHIDVTQTKITSKRIRLHVKVKDTGIGIPKDKYNDVFEEFKQTSASTTREYGGTGLGLPIVKKLLQSMDSDIQLESEVGVGSLFSFEIEFLIGDKKKKIISENEDVVFDDSLKGASILLVEDNKINQMVARKFLLEWKCKVDIADNGQIALDKLQENVYDAILMDLQMPVMDGYTASMEIRKMPDSRVASIPIIALSASALGEIETRARKYGMDDFVTKPFVPKVLYKTILKHTVLKKGIDTE